MVTVMPLAAVLAMMVMVLVMRRRGRRSAVSVSRGERPGREEQCEGAGRARERRGLQARASKHAAGEESTYRGSHGEGRGRNGRPVFGWRRDNPYSLR